MTYIQKVMFVSIGVGIFWQFVVNVTYSTKENASFIEIKTIKYVYEV